MNRKKNKDEFNASVVNIYESEFLEFSSHKKYDLVIAEGCIPGQIDPATTLRHIAKSTINNGVLITTTSSYCSILSEICRKVFVPKVKDDTATYDDAREALIALFFSHLKTLNTKTRPVKDWVEDNMLQDFSNGQYNFTMKDAVNALEPEFEFLSSSPKLSLDCRWYKKNTPDKNNTNEIFKSQYDSFHPYFLDYRYSIDQATHAICDWSDFEKLAEEINTIQETIWRTHSYEKIDKFSQLLLKLEKQLPPNMLKTKKSILCCNNAILSFLNNETIESHQNFAAWWGRGQQYISFILK